MGLEEEFDGIIKRKAEGAEFPFVESDWANAAKMIDASHKGSWIGRKAVVAISALLLITTGVVSYVYFAGGKGTLVTDKNNSLPDQQLPQQAAQRDALNSQDANPTENNAVISNVPDVNNIEENGTKNSTTAGNQATAAKPHTTASPEGSVNNSQATAAKNAQPASISSARKEHIASAKKETPSAETEVNNGTGTESKASGQIAKTPDATPESLSEPEARKQLANQEILESSPAVEMEPLNAARPADKDVSYLFLDGFMSGLTSDNDVMSSIVFSQDNDIDYYKKNGKRKIHYLLAEAGAAYSLGWKVAGGATDGKGLNWFGGLTYGRYFTRQMSVSVGGQFGDLSAIATPFYSVTAKSYDFYVKSTDAFVTTNHLYFISVPVKLNFSLNNRHHFGAGIAASYIVSAANTVKTVPPGGDENGITYAKTNGVYDGVNRLNWAITASYRWNVTRAWSVGVDGSVGLTDMFANSSFNSNSEKTVFVRFGIGYLLFNK